MSTGGRVLRGDHCYCPSCAQWFNSTRAHERHRAGDFGKDRRCLTPDEMKAIGMAKNQSGWWVTKRTSQQFRSSMAAQEPTQALKAA